MSTTGFQRGPAGSVTGIASWSATWDGTATDPVINFLAGTAADLGIVTDLLGAAYATGQLATMQARGVYVQLAAAQNILTPITLQETLASLYLKHKESISRLDPDYLPLMNAIDTAGDTIVSVAASAAAVYEAAKSTGVFLPFPQGPVTVDMQRDTFALVARQASTAGSSIPLTCWLDLTVVQGN